MALIKNLTTIDKPFLSYEEKKPRLLSIKVDEKKKRYIVQIRRQKKMKGDEKTNPIIHINFQQGDYTRAFVDSFLWWANEILYCQRNNHSFGDSHHMAIAAMRTKCPKQFAKIEDRLELDLVRANTMETLCDLYLKEYEERTELQREPHEDRKGNRSPLYAQQTRIKFILSVISPETDPLTVTPKYLDRLFKDLAKEKSKQTGNPYKYQTLKTQYAMILTIFRRATLEKNRWIDINPLQNLTIKDMPGYDKGERGVARDKDVQKKLSKQERAWLIQAMDDKPMIKFLVTYLLHKPSRGSEVKDMKWKDLRFDKEAGVWFVYCKVDRKRVAVTYQEVPLPFVMNKAIAEWHHIAMVRGHGAQDQRVLWGISDEHLCYNRSIRDLIKHRIKKWNQNHPQKTIPIYSEIINTLRTNAFYYLLDLGLDIKSVADIGGTSVEQIERKYCTDSKANIRDAGRKLLQALDRPPEDEELLGHTEY
jgi:hypothetical protein